MIMLITKQYNVANDINNQGHLTTVFCKVFVRRRKYCVEFSIVEV